MGIVDSWLAALAPELVWGLLTRGIGLIYLISFTSIAAQVVPAAGVDSVNPIGEMLASIRRDFPTWKRFVHFPTVLWLNSSDLSLRLLSWFGLACAVAVIYGGEYSQWAMIACYVTYVSLDKPMGLVFPWDCVLFEAGFLGSFLAPTLALPDVAATAAPAPAIAWAVRILVFRVLFGFGKFKFTGATKDDWNYLHGFLVNQPLASAIGLYMQKLPLWVLRVSMVLMFLAEIPIPPLLFVPNALGVVAGVAIVGLMFGIWASGNFGFFNLAIIVLCLSTLDVTTPRALLDTAFTADGPWLVNSVVLLHTFGALIVFPLNSFCAQQWPYWTAFLQLRPKFLQWPVAFMRALLPFRVVHPFGVFPPKMCPGVKVVPVVEVKYPGQDWEEIEYQLSASKETSQPHFIAPHHPRGDQAVIYETFGFNMVSVLHGILGSGNPYGWGKLSQARAIMQRVLEGKVRTVDGIFFKRGTFQAGRAPEQIRISTYMLEPTTHHERVKTGKWWRRSYIGPHEKAQKLNPSFWQRRLPPPELWHPEDVIWRRRSVLQRVAERVLSGQDISQAIIADTTELTADDVTRFWSEFVPFVAAQDRSDWRSLPQAVKEARERFDEDTLYRFERILGRLTFGLVSKVEPIFLDAGIGPLLGSREPVIKAKGYFQLWLLAQQVILGGKERLNAVLREPMSINVEAESFTLASGMYAMAVFRYDNFVFEAQKGRLAHAILEVGRPQFSLQNAELSAKLDGIAERAWGAVETVKFLQKQFQGAEFEAGFPERYPTFTLSSEGIYVTNPLPPLAPGSEVGGE